MSQIPQDIDRTLWAIAESNDPRAIDEFGIRYPAFKAELVARVELVRSLKSQRPYREVPYLALPQTQSRPRLSRGLGFVLAFAAMASLAFASIVIVKPWNHVPLAKVETSGNSTVTTDPVQTNRPKETANQPDKLARTPDVRESAPVPPVPDLSSQVPTALLRLVQVDHENVKLSQVIREIGQQARLKVEVAPGMEDQVISAKYRGVPAKQALEDLGQNFGFTVLVQEENHVLIVPAIDPNRAPVLVPDGSFSEPTEGDSGNQPLAEPSIARKHQ